MRKFCFLVYLLFSINMLFAQKQPTFIEIDTATYRAYLNSDWNRIIEIGNKALANNIDYYYLRMRIAYAWFVKKRYALAIPHYKKALEFSNNDVVALEYLYNSYQYTVRNNEAEKLASNFPTALKTYFHKEDSKKITSLEFYTTIGSGANNALKDNITQTAPTNMDGSQVVPNSFYNFNFGLSHKVGNSILVNHQANLLYKDEYALAVVNSNSYLSESQVVRQIAYSLLVDVTSKNGLILSPFLAYVNYRIPIYYDYGMGSNRNRDVFRYDNHSEIALGFKASKHIKMVELTLAAYFSNFNLSKQKTLAASWSLLPFSNLNLYYSLSAYLHIQNQNASSIQQLVQSHKIGFKVIPNLWLEGYIIAGGFTNLYDPFTNFTYNSLEQYNSIAGANIMVPLFNFKLTIFAGYRHYESESMFVSINNVFEKYNTKEFSYQSFTGGLLWKL